MDSRIIFLLFMVLVRRVLSGQMNTAASASWALPYGLDIDGLWSFTVKIKGCKNMQIGLWGPTKQQNNGYFIDLNKQSGGAFYSRVRRKCSSCPGTPEEEVDQGSSFFTCDTTFRSFWFSWDNCTIRMGRGAVVKQQEVISWMDTNILEINYVTFGASDGSSVSSYKIVPTTPDPTANTVPDCASVPCAAQNRPAMTANFPHFVFHLSGEGKTFSNNDDVSFTGTGLTRKQCNNKCLCDAQCIQFSVSTTGTCKLSYKCYPALTSDASSKVYTLATWGGQGSK